MGARISRINGGKKCGFFIIQSSHKEFEKYRQRPRTKNFVKDIVQPKKRGV